MNFRELEGKRIGPYQVQALVGQGRSACVYSALDPHTRSEVALKVFDPVYSSEPVGVLRLKREGEALKRIRHPNVIALYDTLSFEGLEILILEYFQARTLFDAVFSTQGLPVETFLVLARQMADALQYCHERGMVHRDLKPQNILFKDNRQIKIVDFGVSRFMESATLTQTGQLLGTPEYMAPDIYLSQDADPRSDLYSLGAVFYFMLRGRPPFLGRTTVEVMQQQLAESVPVVSEDREDVPTWVSAIVRKCLFVDSSLRYQSALELRQDIDRGFKSLAQFDVNRDQVKCFHCSQKIIQGLPFCHECGRFLSAPAKRGAYSVVLDNVQDAPLVAWEIHRLCPAVPVDRIRRGLRARTKVLIKKVDEYSAAKIMSDLNRLPCAIQLMRNLSTQLRLPLVVVGAIALVFTLFGATVEGLEEWYGIVFVSILIEIALVAFYMYYTRAMIPRRFAKDQAGTEKKEVLTRFATGLANLKNNRLKSGLGHLVRKYLLLKGHSASVARSEAVEQLKGVIERLFEEAGQAEISEEVLRSTNVAALVNRRRDLDRQIADMSPGATVREAIEQKAIVSRQIEDYLHVQDNHSQVFAAVASLHSRLDEFRAKVTIGDVDADR